MLDYREMKAVLKASPEGLKLKYFTKEFYRTFCESKCTRNWEPVFSTDFYIKEGFSYCVFLELFNDSLSRWQLTFVKMEFGYPIDIAHRYVSADTEEDAKSIGLESLEKFNADYVRVARVEK